MEILWSRSRFFLEELEPFFISWASRVPQKSFSLILIDCLIGSEVQKESMEVIEKFQKLGVIKKFKMLMIYKFGYYMF